MRDGRTRVVEYEPHWAASSSASFHYSAAPTRACTAGDSGKETDLLLYLNDSLQWTSLIWFLALVSSPAQLSQVLSRASSFDLSFFSTFCPSLPLSPPCLCSAILVPLFSLRPLRTCCLVSSAWLRLVLFISAFYELYSYAFYISLVQFWVCFHVQEVNGLLRFWHQKNNRHQK